MLACRQPDKQLRKDASAARTRSAATRHQPKNARLEFFRSERSAQRGSARVSHERATEKVARLRPTASGQLDPIIQFPDNSQSLNPYSYILNNPLSGTDPTGYACVAATGTRIKTCETVTVTATTTGGGTTSASRQMNAGTVARYAAAAGGNGAAGAGVTGAASRQEQKAGTANIGASSNRGSHSKADPTLQENVQGLMGPAAMMGGQAYGALQLFDGLATTASDFYAAGKGHFTGDYLSPYSGHTLGANERRHAVAAAASLLVGGIGAAPRTAVAPTLLRGETKFTAAGRLAHALEPLPAGFVRDIRIPGTRLRMDGYNQATKEILELKPNTASQIRRGERQLDGYCTACDASSFGPGHMKRPVQTYDPKKYFEYFQ